MAGTFYVVKYPPAANQVSVTTTNLYEVNYVSTGGNGAETVKVTISNGLISVSASGIEMLNASGGTDSSALYFNITENNN
jgi:hypothetical protein